MVWLDIYNPHEFILLAFLILGEAGYGSCQLKHKAKHLHHGKEEQRISSCDCDYVIATAVPTNPYHTPNIESRGCLITGFAEIYWSV